MSEKKRWVGDHIEFLAILLEPHFRKAEGIKLSEYHSLRNMGARRCDC